MNIEKIADQLFGSANDCIALIKQQKWKEAAGYGDHVSYKAATNNEEWWWNQVTNLQHVDKKIWNSCSYGNCAMAVYYGEQFEERKETVEKIKMILKRDL
jgi:hypothetical protein